MRDIIDRYANRKGIISFLILYVLINLAILPNLFFVPHPSPELHLTYSSEEAYEYIESYHLNQDEHNMLIDIIIDTVYPIIVSMFLCILIEFFWKNKVISIMPVSLIAVDYVENFGLMSLVYNYPTKMVWLANIISGFTSIKWLLFGTFILIALVGLIRHLIKNANVIKR